MIRRSMRVALAGTVLAGMAGCRTPAEYRDQADRVAYDIIAEGQSAAVGRNEPFSIEPASETLRKRLLQEQDLPVSDPASLGSADVERIPQWPDADYGLEAGDPAASTAGEFQPTLLETLQIAARNSREYQDQKETVFEAALRLDLERNEFRNIWSGSAESTLSTNGGGEERVSGSETTAGLGLERKLMTGATFALDLGVDLVKLLTQDKASALGTLADATLSIPLLRGSGRFVVTEPLTQAERDVVYAIYVFERFKRTFAVRVASDYLRVLQQLDQVDNARESYGRLVLSTRRARRLADAGELPEIQVDQARQDELRARNRWITAQTAYESSLDGFKVLLGLPADAEMTLDRAELDRLVERAKPLVESARVLAASAVGAEAATADDPVELVEASRSGGGPLEMNEPEALRLALGHRLDLRTRIGHVFDAQRKVAVAADQLRADLLLLGRGTAGESRALGSAAEGDADVDFSAGRFSVALGLDLPLERTAERNQYRSQLIAFEQAVRAVQETEDQVKLEIRDGLRGLLEYRESVAIQATSVEVARRRLASTTMFLEAGRVEIRDVLDAEESLLEAQNALSAALVSYRVGELGLQRDLGLLEIDEEGLWTEFVPPSGGADSQ